MLDEILSQVLLITDLFLSKCVTKYEFFFHFFFFFRYKNIDGKSWQKFWRCLRFGNKFKTWFHQIFYLGNFHFFFFSLNKWNLKFTKLQIQKKKPGKTIIYKVSKLNSKDFNMNIIWLREEFKGQCCQLYKKKMPNFWKSNFQKNYQIFAICQKIGIYQNPSICHFASEDISRNCPFFSSKMVNLPKIAIFIDGNLSVR